jgi:hypothetical protein
MTGCPNWTVGNCITLPSTLAKSAPCAIKPPQRGAAVRPFDQNLCMAFRASAQAYWLTVVHPRGEAGVDAQSGARKQHFGGSNQDQQRTVHVMFVPSGRVSDSEETGHLFRSEAGQGSDLKLATVDAAAVSSFRLTSFPDAGRVYPPGARSPPYGEQGPALGW